MTDQQRVEEAKAAYIHLCGTTFVANERYVQLVRSATVRLAEFLHEQTRAALLAKAPQMKFSQERVEMYRVRADQLKQRLLSKPLLPSDVLQTAPPIVVSPSSTNLQH